MYNKIFNLKFFNFNRRKKQNIKNIFLILLIIYFIIYFLINTFGKPIPINDQLPKLQVEKTTPETATEVPIRNLDWEQMNANVFFRRTGAFYIIEKQLLRLFYVAKSGINSKFNIVLNIEYKKKLISTYIFNNINIKNHKKLDYYLFNSLDLNLNLTDYVSTNDYSLLMNESIFRFNLMIFNEKFEQTKNPIQLNIRYIRKRENFTKSGSMVCSKCLFLNHNDYKELIWWIELNKMIGYKKIVFCNISIPNTHNFNMIFEKNKDFIELIQFKSIPNLVDKSLNQKSHKYLTDYFELKKKNGHRWSRDMFDGMIETECFYNNAGQYEFIAINDNDETVIPRINSKVMKNTDNFNYLKNLNLINQEKLNLETSCEQNIDKRLKPYLAKIAKNTNFYFPMVFYLSDIVVNEIFDAFEIYFNSNKFNSKSYHHRIHNIVKKRNRAFFNYTFLISGKEDLKYARNLLNVYKYYYKNIYEKNVNISHISKKFGSLFYLAGKSVSRFYGKTVYDTELGFGLSVHTPTDSKYKIIEFDDGHVSHFREAFELNPPFSQNKKDISIRELMFDFNYFNCFYKHIINSINNYD